MGGPLAASVLNTAAGISVISQDLHCPELARVSALLLPAWSSASIGNALGRCFGRGIRFDHQTRNIRGDVSGQTILFWTLPASTPLLC